MLTIRLQRFGKKGAPIYRIAVIPKSDKRDGKPVEVLGFYNPRTKELVLNTTRAKYWQSVGAQPSDTVASLLKRSPDHNLEDGAYKFTAKTRADKQKRQAEIKSKSTKIGKAETNRRATAKEEAEKREAEAAAAAEAAKAAAEAPAVEEVPAA